MINDETKPQATSSQPFAANQEDDILDRFDAAMKRANERNKGRSFEEVNRENLEYMAKLPKIELKNPPQI